MGLDLYIRQTLDIRGFSARRKPGKLSFFRTIWVYCVAVLVMHLLLGVGLYLGFVVEIRQHSGLIEQLTKILDIYQIDSTSFSPVDLPDSSVREQIKYIAPVLVKIDWSKVAILASLLTFPLLGFLCGRFKADPAWAGVLPLGSIFTGSNPLLFPSVLEMQGVKEVHISLLGQIGIFTLQMLLVYAFALYGWWRCFGGKFTELPPDAEIR